VSPTAYPHKLVCVTQMVFATRNLQWETSIKLCMVYLNVFETWKSAGEIPLPVRNAPSNLALVRIRPCDSLILLCRQYTQLFSPRVCSAMILKTRSKQLLVTGRSQQLLCRLFPHSS
jgi:hypothetical protein